MSAFYQNRSPKVKTIYGSIAVTGTATSKAINNFDCRIECLSGNLWINPNATAVADGTAIKLTSSIDPYYIRVFGSVSLISDGDGAVAQIVIFE